MPPLNPDVTIVHAQRADAEGNTQIWGLLGCQKEAAFAADRVIVVVEELVDESVVRADPNRTVIPGLIVDAVVVDPFGAHPSYVQGAYDRDNRFYLDWDPISRDEEKTQAWLGEWVYDLRRPRGLHREAGRGAGRVAAARQRAVRVRRLRGLPMSEPLAGATAPAFSKSEMMIVAAARELAGQHVCFVGVGLPNIAVNLAKRTVAPDLELVYEAGVFGARPARLPLSIGDPTIVTGATAVVVDVRAVRVLPPARPHRRRASSARPRSTGSATSTRRSSATTTHRRRGCRAPAARARSRSTRARCS